MGEASELILDGIVCQFCGCYIDEGKGCGYPRSCSGCGGDDDDDYEPKPKLQFSDTEELEYKLVEAGFDITQRRELDWAIQLRIVGGAIVNVFTNKRGKRTLQLQGKENQELKNFIETKLQK